MTLELGKKFWVLATVAIFVFTALIVGRNLLHVVQIKSQIGDLEDQQTQYRARIEQDSTLLEQLKYNDYLEEYARENFRMQRSDERVYVVAE